MLVKTYEDFEKAIYKITDIDLKSYKERQMKRRIDFQIDRLGLKTYEEYFTLLKKDSKILAEFKSYITINVSEFFRNIQQWKNLQNNIIPKLLNKKGNKKIKIWSAACSTGDEPYSLAMMFLTKFPDVNFEILATDIDDEILKKAKVAKYPYKSIEKIDNIYKKMYFTKVEEDYYEVKENVKKYVTFKRHNLIEDTFYRGMDLIVCRNVVIYFTEDVKDLIYQKFSDIMEKNSVLFIGNTEQIMNASKYDFETIISFFYEKI